MKQIPYEKNPPRRLPENKIETEPMGEEWKEWLKGAWWSSFNIEKQTGPDKPDDGYLALHKVLLSIGGEETCYAFYEEDLQNILDRAYFLDGRRSRLIKGTARRCHSNACRIWRSNPDKDIHIMTGYALSADGMWRQHSWLLERYNTATQKRMRIIETTEKRVAYFGFELDDEEAVRFCCENS